MALGSEPGSAVPHASSPSSATPVPTADGKGEARPRSRASMAIVVVVVVVAAAGYWLLNRPREGYKLGNVSVTGKTGTFAVNPQFADAAPFPKD